MSNIISQSKFQEYLDEFKNGKTTLGINEWLARNGCAVTKPKEAFTTETVEILVACDAIWSVIGELVSPARLGTYDAIRTTHRHLLEIKRGVMASTAIDSKLVAVLKHNLFISIELVERKMSEAFGSSIINYSSSKMDNVANDKSVNKRKAKKIIDQEVVGKPSASNEGGNQKLNGDGLKFRLQHCADPNKPVAIYAVFKKRDGKEKALKTQLKVCGKYWDSDMQCAAVSVEFTPAENRRNNDVNNRLEAIRNEFAKANENIIPSEDKNSGKLVSVFRNAIKEVKGSVAPKRLTGELLLLNIGDKNTSVVRKHSRECALRQFAKFLRMNNLNDAPASVTLNNWDAFVDYMVLTGVSKHNKLFAPNTVKTYISGMKKLFKLYNESNGGNAIELNDIR